MISGATGEPGLITACVCRSVASARRLIRRSGQAARSIARCPHRKNSMKVARVPTYTPKASEIQRAWYVVDAEGMVLGRLATEVARVLRGKHKPVFAPHIDTGDHVIVVNADKVVLTSDKADRKVIYTHSGYPGGQREHTPTMIRAKHPERLIEHAVRGMLPKNRLGRELFRSLHVYAGTEHPHQAQQPKEIKF